MATINGVVLSKENIAMMKQAQEHFHQKEIEKGMVIPISKLVKAKTKISHAARKARKVAASIAADPKKNSGFKAKVVR